MASRWYILARLRSVLIFINEAIRSTLSTSYRLAGCTVADDEEYGLASVAVAALGRFVPDRNCKDTKFSRNCVWFVRKHWEDLSFVVLNFLRKQTKIIYGFFFKITIKPKLYY